MKLINFRWFQTLQTNRLWTLQVLKTYRVHSLPSVIKSVILRLPIISLKQGAELKFNESSRSYSRSVRNWTWWVVLNIALGIQLISQLWLVMYRSMIVVASVGRRLVMNWVVTIYIQPNHKVIWTCRWCGDRWSDHWSLLNLTRAGIICKLPIWGKLSNRIW